MLSREARTRAQSTKREPPPRPPETRPGHAPGSRHSGQRIPAGTHRAGGRASAQSHRPGLQPDGLDPDPTTPRPPGPLASPRPRGRPPPRPPQPTPAAGGVQVTRGRVQEVECGAHAHIVSSHSLLLSDAHTQTDQSWGVSAVQLFRPGNCVNLPGLAPVCFPTAGPRLLRRAGGPTCESHLERCEQAPMSPRCPVWSGLDCSPEASRPLVTGVTLPGRGFLQATQLGRRPEIEDPKSTAFCQPGGGAKVRSLNNTPSL